MPTYNNHIIVKRVILFGLLIFLLISISSCKNEAANNKITSNPETIPEEIVLGNSSYISDFLIKKDSTQLFEKDSVRAFYKERNNQPAWSNSYIKKCFFRHFKKFRISRILF